MNKNGDKTTKGQVPLGLGMSLAQDEDAMIYFATLSKSQQRAVIESARKVRTKAEMQALVSGLTDENDIKM